LEKERSFIGSGTTYRCLCKGLIQFLGDGIFGVDGSAWSDARALLRPHFHKQRISDLEIFEKKVNLMISLLPKDGGTVDMMDWFSRFALDASTEFLFGQSVDSLNNPHVLARLR
jgi:cytochrome P450